MPKFNVRISQAEHFIFTVEAENETEAGEKALERFRDSDDGDQDSELQDACIELVVPNTTD